MFGHMSGVLGYNIIDESVGLYDGECRVIWWRVLGYMLHGGVLA